MLATLLDQTSFFDPRIKKIIIITLWIYKRVMNFDQQGKLYYKTQIFHS